MFSALKSKLTSSPSASNAGGGANASSDKNDTESSNHHGINSMNAALQRKFAKGVNYNLKLLLRGDRNTGKSCLFKRLQVCSIFSFKFNVFTYGAPWEYVTDSICIKKYFFYF